MALGRYLRGEGSPNQGGLRRFISLLLSAIENHTVEGDEADYQHFRAAIREVSGRFSEETSVEDMLVMAGTISTTCKEYAERTRRFIRAHSAELQHIVSMLTGAITTSMEASESSITRLQTIEKQLERAAVIEDVRTLRLKLAQCLEGIQEEIVQRQQDVATASADLQRTGRLSNPEDPKVTLDAITGVPGRPQAEDAMKQALQSGRQHYVVVVVANRIKAINSRFGYPAGDRVLRCLCKQLQAFVSETNCVFRWTGPAYVALLHRETPIDELRRQVQRAGDKKFQEVFEVESRSVSLPVSATWAVLAISHPLRPVMAALDLLVAAG